MMKKRYYVVVFLLVALMLQSALAVSYSVTVTHATGKYAPLNGKKETSTGSAAKINVDDISNSEASMYYQIRKTDNYPASVELIKKGTGNYTAAYNNDGNGNSLGMYNHTYKLRIAHRSQCTCIETNVTVDGSYYP